MRPEGCYRGAFEVGPELAKDGEEGEAEEETTRGKLAAKPEDLAKFVVAAIAQFEGRFAITAETKLEALHQVVEELVWGRE